MSFIRAIGCAVLLAVSGQGALAVTVQGYVGQTLDLSEVGKAASLAVGGLITNTDGGEILAVFGTDNPENTATNAPSFDSFCAIAGPGSFCIQDFEIEFDEPVQDVAFEIAGGEGDNDSVTVGVYSGLDLLDTVVFDASGVADLGAYSGITRLTFAVSDDVTPRDGDIPGNRGVSFGEFENAVLAPIPLPATLPLFMTAFLGLYGLRRRLQT